VVRASPALQQHLAARLNEADDSLVGTRVDGERS